MGNRPNLGRARRLPKRSRMIAIQRRRRYQGTSPSGSTSLARGSRMCSSHLPPNNHMSALHSHHPTTSENTTYLESLLEDVPELFRLVVAGVVDLDCAPLRNDLLGSERPLGVPPSRIRPPLLNSGNLSSKSRVLLRQIRRRRRHLVRSHN
jgi:hypothetical protein